MDDPTTDLIVQLCTRAGMIMEDHADAAVAIAGAPPERWLAVIDGLGRAASEIGVLVEAARVLATRER